MLTDYFKRGIVSIDPGTKVDFAVINKKAVKLGWLIPLECCNVYVSEWLDSLTANHNATFYKVWNDVISKSRFELYLDQIRHYASTYGKLAKGEEVEGNGYVPNNGAIVPRFEDLKVLEPITEEELAAKCFGVLKSGIALKDATMKVMCDFWLSQNQGDANKDVCAEKLSEVKNKEAMCYLSQKLRVLPADEFGMLRCIAFAYTGRMELIKSKATLAVIKAKADDSTFHPPLLDLTEKQEKQLSRIFLRFKPIFLAMKGKIGKKRSKTASVVNRLRRLAEKNHKPFKIGFWESIIKTEQPMEEVKKRLADLDNFRKIRLMMLCKERMNFTTDYGVFTIRNGKQFVRMDYSPKYNKNWISRLYFAIEESIVESLKSKACTVKFPEHHDLVLPTSEKNFVGNFPYGTSFGMGKHNIVGVYWRNEWHTDDYDLSMTDMSGNHISWDASFYNCAQAYKSPSVVFSGDMTHADPEAVELLYIRNDAPDGIVKLNKFYGDDDSKFRFFYATENLDGITLRNHMVNPNNIRFDTMIDFIGQGQKTIGLLVNNRFYLMDEGTGYSRVASRQSKYAPATIAAMRKKMQCFIPIREILLRAGFQIWEPPKEGEAETKPGLDLSHLEKDTLINLLAK